MSLIKAAEMKNFRGYGDRNNVVKFSPGINLVLGDNATGKSSIVTLALFNLLHKKIDVGRFDEYRTLEPRDMGPFEATLTIMGRDGREYSIRKYLVGEKVKWSIMCDGTELKKVGELEVVRRQADMQRFITDRLGTTEEILEDILIQTQDPVKLLWPVGRPKDVGAKLSKLFRFEALQRIYTNAKSSSSMLDGESKRCEEEIKRIERDIENLKLAPPEKYAKQRKLLERKRGAEERKKAKLESDAATLGENYDKLERKITGLEQKVGGLKKLDEQINRKRQEVEGKAKPKKTSDWLKAKEKSIDGQLRSLRTRLASASANVIEQNKVVKNATMKKDELVPKIEKDSEEYRSLVRALEENGVKVEFKNDRDADRFRKSQETERRGLEREIGGLESQTKIQVQYVNILKKAKANCPVCDTGLTKEQREKILREKSALVKELKAEIKRRSVKSKNAEKLVSLLEEVTSVLRKLGDLTQKLSQAERDLKSGEKKLPSLLKKEEAIKKKEEKLEQLLEKIRGNTQLAEAFENINRLNREIEALKKETKLLPKLKARSTKLKIRNEKLQGKLRKIEAKIGEFGPKIELVKQNEKNARVYYDRLAEAEKRHEVTCAFADEVKLACEAAKTSLHELLVEYRDMINHNLSWIWPMLYPRKDLPAVELEVKIEETEEGGEKTLVTETQLVRLGADGQKIPFNTISSHGQRVLASIAFRVSFLNLLWKTSVPRILVLDEPTIWVDNRNRERLGQLLANLVKEMKEGALKLDQVIVVSHDPAFLNAIDPEGVKHTCIKNEEGFCEVRTAES
ncbi:MAG: AAA family ATPase [Hadesarchaea archaeon]|nr:AAA family ATPase [Hadesarchaea archaeon]